MLDMLSYDFMINALTAGILTSILCGIIGTFIVTRRMVFISAGISHISFGGLGVAYFLKIQPLLGALVFALSSSTLLAFLPEKRDKREDSLIGTLWSVGMAVGIIFISLTPGFTPDLTGFLFGNILTVSSEHLIRMLILITIATLIITFFFKEFIAISFDYEFSKVQGLRVQFFNLLLITLIALAIVLLINVAGITLVIALLTIPPSAALFFHKRILFVILLSIIFGIISSTTGIILSFNFGIPSGPAIILISFLFLIAGYAKSKIVDKE